MNTNRHHDERGEFLLSPRNKRFIAAVRREMKAQGVDYNTAFNSVMADPQALAHIDQGKPGQQFSNEDLAAQMADSAAASKEFSKLVKGMIQTNGWSYQFAWNRTAKEHPELLKRMAKPSDDPGLMQFAVHQGEGQQVAIAERPSTTTKAYPPQKGRQGPIGQSRPGSLRGETAKQFERGN